MKNHPFVDGNRRIGLAVALLCLELNDHRFSPDEVDGAIKTLALAADQIDERGYARWLEANMHRGG